MSYFQVLSHFVSAVYGQFLHQLQVQVA